MLELRFIFEGMSAVVDDANHEDMHVTPHCPAGQAFLVYAM